MAETIKKPAKEFKVTPAQIKQWKQRHGEVFELSVKTDTGVKLAYFKRPAIATMTLAGQAYDTDAMKAATILFNDCQLAVDPQILEEDAARFSAYTQVGNLFKFYESEIKKI